MDRYTQKFSGKALKVICVGNVCLAEIKRSFILKTRVIYRGAGVNSPSEIACHNLVLIT